METKESIMYTNRIKIIQSISYLLCFFAVGLAITIISFTYYLNDKDHNPRRIFGYIDGIIGLIITIFIIFVTYK